MRLYTKEHGWRTPAELAALSAGNRAASFVNDPSSLLDIPESEKCWCHVCKKEVISCVCPQRLSTWFTRICIQVAHLNSDKCIFCGTSFPAEVLRCLCNWLLQTLNRHRCPKGVSRGYHRVKILCGDERPVQWRTMWYSKR
jgi:hypothetical protein